jgi:UPF0755 protein
LKKAIIIAIIVFCVIGGTVGAIIFNLWQFSTKAADNIVTEKSITIRPGQTLKNTAAFLRKEGIITSASKFAWLARLKDYDKRLQAGEYILSASMTPLKILDMMVNGSVKLYKITIPEGFNNFQIAEIVTKSGFATQIEFLNLASDTVTARKMGIEAATLEGYLFPDTYFFPKGVAGERIISKMVARFREVFSEDWKKQAQKMGFSIHQVVTLASIIEKETGAPIERPIISSVFHNRLKKGMRLETDPTVIYGIKDFDGNLTRKHLATPTPYNTYKIKGLPPGPIANPGFASLEAALFPAETSFLYFVSKKDSTHHFSKNLIDHNKAVKKYQLRRSR